MFSVFRPLSVLTALFIILCIFNPVHAQQPVLEKQIDNGQVNSEPTQPNQANSDKRVNGEQDKEKQDNPEKDLSAKPNIPMPTAPNSLQGAVTVQQSPPAPFRCDTETEFSVWVFGGTTNQGQLICFKSDDRELQTAPSLMTQVFARVGGFQAVNGLYDQIFVYDMVQTDKHGNRAKPKRRMFDYEEMEFQRLNFLPWCQQDMDISAGKEYVVFVKTPATNYWFDLASRAISTGTTLGSVLAGYFIAK